MNLRLADQAKLNGGNKMSEAENEVLETTEALNDDAEEVDVEEVEAIIL